MAPSLPHFRDVESVPILSPPPHNEVMRSAASGAHSQEGGARLAERHRKVVPVLALLFSLLVLMLVTALILSRGEPGPVMLAVVLGILAAFLLWNPTTGARLRQTLGTRGAQIVAAMVVPSLFLSGILGGFGGMLLLLTVLVLAAAALVLAARPRPLQGVGPVAPPHSPAATVPSLPAVASGDPLPELDIRELCRALPKALVGEVMATVEHLEAAEAHAAKSGDVRRCYDAAQSLRDYLPGTVNAWKEQAPEQRDPEELVHALEQVKRIAGTEERGSSSARHNWETQKRFLESRSQKGPLELK